MESNGFKAISVDNDNNYKEFIVDTEADIEKLPTTRYFGSCALCIETGDVYVLNTKGVWTKL